MTDLRSMGHKRDFFRDSSGATAVEFAFVSSFFIFTILFIMTVSLIIYYNLALDFATGKAARQIMTGSVQKQSLAQPAFVSSILCPYLPAAMACGDVIVNVYTIAEAAGPQGYYAYANSGTTALTTPTLSNANATFSPGTQQSFEYVQVVYPVTLLPSFIASLIGGGATYKGAPAFVITSTAAFKNEQY